MAKYDHLPIFKKSYDLCLEIELIRLAFDLKCLKSLKHYERLSGILTEISRQNEGWLKSANQQNR